MIEQRDWLESHRARVPTIKRFRETVHIFVTRKEGVRSSKSIDRRVIVQAKDLTPTVSATSFATETVPGLDQFSKMAIWGD